MDLAKTILIEAITSLPAVMGYEDVEPMNKRKLISFCGNQWNPDWCWNTQELNRMNFEDLQELYLEKSNFRQRANIYSKSKEIN